MMITSDIAWYWLINTEGLGRRSIEKLLDVFENPEEIYYADERTIESLDILNNKQKNNLKNKDIDSIIRQFDYYNEKGIRFVHYDSEDYPERLRLIDDRPYGLYVRGDCDSGFAMFDKPCVAIIGSRKCSDYGYNIAYNMALEIASHDITIISGLARGIDGAAGRGAIAAGGTTCSVLGCGVDICYPPDNIDLYMELVNNDNGMVISEYIPGTKPLAGFFPERNRIISGLSDIIIVVEAGKKSGSLITIDMALEQGKDVYAVPGRITDAGSYGCNHLIKNGAGIYTGVKDILEELGISIANEGTIDVQENNSLATEEKMVYAKIRLEPKHIDKVIEETGLSAEKVMESLLSLEMRHMVRQSTYNYYVIEL